MCPEWTSKGYEIKYDVEKNKCVKEFWDGSKYDRASKDLSLKKCQGFIEALKVKESNNGSCNAQIKLTDIKTVLGVTGKEEIR